MAMEKKRKASLIKRVEQAPSIRAIRAGLVNIIPVLLVGAFALILKTFPVDGYQKAISSFAGGVLLSLFDIVFSATFGALSIYMTVFISRAYVRIKGDRDTVTGGAIIASLISFFILAGANLSDFGTDSMGPKSMFLAIVTGLGSTRLYLLFDRLLHKKRRRLFSSGANREFNRMISTLAPIGICVLIMALIDVLVERLFGVDSFRALLAKFFDFLFSFGEVGFFKGFFFVLLSSILWMFGIHGSDTLEGVMQTYFSPGLAANQTALAAGQVPPAILTKEFFDCFVLMGGCGATICLLAALLIFSRNRARRGLAAASAFPMIFNINELMVFGLPVIFNPIMLIPFLAVPLVCYSISYAAVASGLVPHIGSEVAWTTPLFLGGFRATGSAAGAILQGVNFLLGVLIYMPFVRLLDRRTDEEARFVFSSFMEHFKACEASASEERFTERTDEKGEIAKGLTAEIRGMIDRGQFALAYQPQYHYDGRCIGVEALLRVNHPTHGYLYPPLVVRLAQEGSFLPELEEAVVLRVISDRAKVCRAFGEGVKISFNVTGETVITDRFLRFLSALDAKDPFAGKNLCLEVTERSYLAFNEKTLDALESIRKMGILLAIDDFSMGQTSLNYLKDNMFDIIKLDGSLVKGLKTHANCREIISSIVALSASLDLTVLAEFVETEEDRETLHELGCDCYQGYLYSPAVLLDERAKNA